MANVRKKGGAAVVLTAALLLLNLAASASVLLFENQSFRADWKPGEYQWTNLNLTPPMTDWSGYDRLALRIVNRSREIAYFGFYASGPLGRIQDGFKTGQQWLLPFERRLVVCPLVYGKGTDPRNITRCMAYLECPDKIELQIESVCLLGKGEPVPETDEDRRRDVQSTMRVHQEQVARLLDDEAQNAAEHRVSLRRFVADCRKAGSATAAFVVGQATAMEHVRPKAAFVARPVKELAFRLARNEWESMQVLVAQVGRDPLERVRVSVSELRNAAGAVLPSAAITVSPLGYVLTRELPVYRRGRAQEKIRLGWWPDPILDFPLDVSVRDGDVQSFWMRVKCPKYQPSGVYRGAARVEATCHGRRVKLTVPVIVRVNGFTLPDAPAMPLALTFAPRVHFEHMPEAYRQEKLRIAADPTAPVNLWRRHRRAWTDFLSDYYITTGSIAMEGETYDTHPHPDMDELLHLKSRNRLGLFNLGYWHVPGKGEKAWNDWRAKTLPRIRRNLAAAKKANIADRAYLYGCDEVQPDRFADAVRAVDFLKRTFPGVPLFTTSYDSACGTDGSPLSGIDWFCPHERRFDPGVAARARAEGRKVWWYVTGSDKPPFPNVLVESLPIETRLMMGALAAKMKPDGFLYWQITCWNGQKPIESGPFTDWETLSFWYYHGDGYLAACGPDGIPLPTQRLENFRDGLEDLAYVKLLAERDPDSRLLDVPEEVAKSMTDFTEDPEVVLRWRNRLADALEK